MISYHELRMFITDHLYDKNFPQFAYTLLYENKSEHCENTLLIIYIKDIKIHFLNLFIHQDKY